MLLILFAVLVFIYISNFTPNTYLSIWDTIHSEFNFGLDIWRNFFSVWQEYRGLGLLDGMAHAADLPRQVILWFFALFLPQNTIQYLFHFLMLGIGVIGMYLFCHEIISKENEKHNKDISAALGALFYLLNFGTIQYFFTPYEAFSMFWGMFPWLMYILILTLQKATKNNIILFCLINFLSIPSFYIQTIFIVYLLCLILVCSIYILIHRARKSLWLTLKLLFVIFILNSFWLLPSLYFFSAHSQEPRNAKINLMSTEDTYLQNKRRGTITDFLFLRGYYYDFVEGQDYMMKPWREHLSKKSVTLVGYVLFLCIVIGLLKKNNYRSYLLALFGLGIFTLLSDNILLSYLHDLLRRFSSFWYQVFRSPFTKFIVPTTFSFAALFSIGSNYFVESIGHFFSNKRILVMRSLFLIFCGTLVYFSLPAFKGYFFSPAAKVKIPSDYFRLFDFFNQRNNSDRIVIFPQSSFWGWNFYNWGYRGSGFLWQGVRQPVMDRAFDVWSNKNENFYWEISSALYSQNLELFEKVLEKYQVSWLIIDGNIINFASPKVLYLNNLYTILSSSRKMLLEMKVGPITIYRVNLDTKPRDFVFLASNLPIIEPKYQWNNYDRAYEEYGNYIAESQKSKDISQNYNLNLKSEIFYPFRSLFTGRKQEELEFNVEDSGDYLIFKSEIPKELVGAKLVIPALVKEEITEIDDNDLSKTTEKLPEIYLDGELIQIPLAISDVSTPGESSSATPGVSLGYIKEGNLEVRVPKIGGYYSFDSEKTGDLYKHEPRSCDQFNKGIYKHDRVSKDGKNLLRLSSIGSSNCLDFGLPNLAQRIGYLLTVEGRNIEGKSLLFSIINNNSQRADLETYLPKNSPGRSNFVTPSRWPKGLLEGEIGTSHFIIPPMEEYALGYTLHFENRSIGRVKTVNDLGRITVNPIPYRFLTGLKIVKGNFDSSTPGESLGMNPRDESLRATPGVSLEVNHPNPSYYQVTLRLDSGQAINNSTLVLSQSFDKGWKAYQIFNFQFSIFNFLNNWFPFIFGKEIKDHVLVNNWENGWRLSDNRQPFGYPSTPFGTSAQSKQSTNNKNATIIIVYLPQYLEYLGFGLLGGCLIVFILTLKFPTNKRQFES